jgi:hypothetical protein
MAATAQILIEVDDSGAVAALRQINAEGAKIGPSLAPAKPALDGITRGSNEARESAALLSEELGTHIPRGLRNVISQSPIMAAGLKAAFSGLVVAGFVEFVKQAVDNLTGYSAALAEIAKQNDAIVQSVMQANKTLIGPQTLQQIDARILQTTQNIAQLNQQLGLTGNALGDALTRGLTKYSAAKTTLVEALDQQKNTLNQLFIEQAKLLDEQKRTEPIAVLQQENAAREAGLLGVKAITQAERDQVAVIRANIAANVTTETLGQAQITAVHAKAAAQRIAFSRAEWDTTRQLAQQAIQSGLQGFAAINESEQNELDNLKVLLDRGLIEQEQFEERKKSIILTHDNQIKLAQIQNANEVFQAENQAAVAMAPPWARSYAQISADTQARLREIQQQLDETRITSEQAAALSAAAWQVNFARTRDQLAQDMESFFDDLTSGNIGKRFKKMFEDLVFQMVATWILGMQSMRSAAATGFGGGPTGILGAILGIGGGGFGGGAGGGQGGISGLPGVITNFAGGGLGPAFSGDLGALPLSIPGLGISAGQGAGLGGVVLPSGSSTGAATAGLTGLLTKIFPHGLSIGGMNISGSALATGGLMLAINGLQRGGILGGLESIGGGALTGFAIGGPIGALIGGAIGLIGSIFGAIFGQHSGDKARIQVMEPMLAAIKQITDSYDVFQTDFNTGESELEKLRSDTLAGLRKIGGKQLKGNTTSANTLIDAAEKHLKDTEAERQRRAQIQFGAPQFHEGGLVRGGPGAIAGRPALHSGGEVNANLLIGEGVLNRRAMSMIGEAGLNRLNAGGGTGITHNHFYVYALDAKSVSQLFRRMQLEGSW